MHFLKYRWMIVGAWDLGAPHVRRRWFCLGVRSDAEARNLLQTTVDRYGLGPSVYPWTEKEPPAVMTLHTCRKRRARCAALGNAVVPDCVRKAFFLLGTLPDSSTATPHDPHATHMPSCGRSIPDPFCVYGHEPVFPWPVCMRTTHHLVFDPQAFHPPKPISKLQCTPVLQTRRTAQRWTTPRHGIVSASNYLTQRGLRDLPTQARFESGTPDHLRRGQISAEFVEYLMGYPVGWTDVPCRTGSNVPRDWNNCPHGVRRHRETATTR